MAENAQITVSSTVKVLENSSEVASRSVSGTISLDEYTQIIDLVAPSAVDKAFTFGGLVDFDFISLESDQDITVKFNATTNQTAFALKAKIVSGTKTTGQIIVSASGLTALFISNASATISAKVKVIFGKYAS